MAQSAGNHADHREVEQIVYRFFLYLDERRYADLCALMAPTGIWHRQGKALQGPEAVMEAMKARPVGFTTRHLVTNVVTDIIDQDRAEATYYMTVFVHSGQEKPAGPVPIALPHHISIFRQSFTRTAQGWRIADISETPTFHS